MILDKPVIKKITTSNHNVTAKLINDKIIHVEYMTSAYSGTIVCIVTLDNGYGVVGSSGYLTETRNKNTSLFAKLKKKLGFEYIDRKHGRQLAYESAISKIWELEAYSICSGL